MCHLAVPSYPLNLPWCASQHQLARYFTLHWSINLCRVSTQNLSYRTGGKTCSVELWVFVSIVSRRDEAGETNIFTLEESSLLRKPFRAYRAACCSMRLLPRYCRCVSESGRSNS